MKLLKKCVELKSLFTFPRHFTTSPKSHANLSEIVPDFNVSYLLNPANAQEIADNITRRKGVGDIQKAHELARTLRANHSPSTEAQLQEELSRIPNNTHPDVINYGEEGKVLQFINEKRSFPFKPQQFSELCRKNNLMRMDNLGNFSGHKSYYLLGDLAELEQALLQYTVDQLSKHQFELISVPDVVPARVIEGCGFSTTGERNQVYKLSEAPLCLSGTAEMALAAFFAGQLLPEDSLPAKVMAVSRCYRAEVSGVQEERGIYRVHQFSKVEMFGVAHPEKSEALLEEFRKFSNLPYVGYYKSFTPAIMVRDPELVKNVLIKDFGSFFANDIAEVDDPTNLLHENPFGIADEHRWKQNRALMSPMFTTNKMKGIFPHIQTSCDKLIKYIERQGSNTDIESKSLSAKFTTENVASCAFSLDANCFEDSNCEFRRMGKKILQPTFWVAIKFMLLFFFPYLVKLFTVDLITKDVDQWIRKLVRENVKSRENMKLQNEDMLQVMLGYREKYGLTLDQITGHAMSFFIDGYETSSTVLAFALWEISRHAEVQQKAYAEIVEVLEKHENKFSYEALGEMVYLDLVIQETQRKNSIGLTLHKACTKPYTLPKLPGQKEPVVLQPGTPVLIPIYSLHKAIQVGLFRDLDLHFQILDMPPTELGAPAYRKYDIEAFLEGRGGYGEISSCSNCTDYQARRLGIRTSSGDFAHTINGTACAVPRMLIAILESFQNADGTISVPDPLRPYVSFDKLTRRKAIPQTKLVKRI